MFCLSYYCYVFSSTKLEKMQNRFCLEARGLGERRRGWGMGRNGPNIVCTNE
jgi:hypothetical protein